MFLKQLPFLILFLSVSYVHAQQDHLTLTTQTIPVGTTQNYEAKISITNPSGTAFTVEGQCSLTARDEITLEDGFEATDGSEFCAITEIPSAYAGLGLSLSASFYLCRNGELKFKYTEDYDHNAEPLEAKVYDNTNQLVQSLSLTKSTGINTYAVDLKASTNYTDGAYYVLQVTDLKKRTYYLRFRYED
jgi:hypothetical protein